MHLCIMKNLSDGKTQAVPSTDRLSLCSDIEKGADTRTLSVEIFENCGNFLIVEDYAPLFSEESFFLVETFDKTYNILHIYSL